MRLDTIAWSTPRGAGYEQSTGPLGPKQGQYVRVWLFWDPDTITGNYMFTGGSHDITQLPKNWEPVWNQL